jgi:hypothetical protein
MKDLFSFIPYLVVEASDLKLSSTAPTLKVILKNA